MRIGIDARFYGPRAGTGIGRYTHRLLEHLQALDSPHDFVVFLGDEGFGAFQARDARFRKVRAPWGWYSAGEQIHFPRLIQSQRLDLTHYLHFNAPLAAPRPFIVTIHDLILSKYPTARPGTLEPLYYWLKHLAYTQVMSRAATRAAAIITDAVCTQRDIVDAYHVAPDKITVVHAACDPPPPLPRVGPDALTRLGVRSLFVLYVGTSFPHKNLERLVDAIARVRSQGSPISLVLVGREDHFYRRLRDISAAKHGAAAAEMLVFTGYVDDDVLDALYRRAVIYACPSLYEGFGLPGLEAMARGTPVVASNVSSLPEVYGDAALFFDPCDTDDIAGAIARLLADESLRHEMIHRGARNLQRFSWRATAERVLGVYDSLERK